MPFTEKPPMLTGKQQDDMLRLRDYLFRLANSLDEISRAPAVIVQSVIAQAAGGSLQGGSAAAVDAVRKSAQELRDLIQKSATEVKSYTDRQVSQLDSKYVAESEFGTYQRAMETRIESLPGLIDEEYRYSERISGLGEYLTEMNGQIRRGYIENPDYPASSSDEYLFGIAISSSLRFTSEIPTKNGGKEYYHLADGQTFGFYTSKGWQFWINGYKSGWFDSEFNMLHVRRVVAEELLQISGKWQIRVADGGHELEFVYVG